MFTLSEAVGDGPIVLAFYSTAFTGGCTAEMGAFRDSIAALEALVAQVYGVSVDFPFAQKVWIHQEELGFPMLSDWEYTVIRQYDVVPEDVYGMLETPERSIFVIDTAGAVADKWIRTDNNPDFDALVTRTKDAVADARSL